MAAAQRMPRDCLGVVAGSLEWNEVPVLAVVWREAREPVRRAKAVLFRNVHFRLLQYDFVQDRLESRESDYLEVILKHWHALTDVARLRVVDDLPLVCYL